MALQVDIVTPRKAAFKGVAAEVRVPGWEGEFGALPGHENVLSLLRGGICVIVGEDRSETRFVVGRGFAEIGPDRVTILTDLAESADQVNKDSAAKDIAEGEKTLAESEDGSAAWALAEERIEIARARLAI
jgi:F-type H+-transporting ATPase subunit epsilon